MWTGVEEDAGCVEVAESETPAATLRLPAMNPTALTRRITTAATTTRKPVVRRVMTG
jgi:hypothetical protein